MKKLVLLAAAAALISSPAFAAAKVGDAAPDFSSTDVLANKPVKLSDLKGKIVVLEWTNAECPFVHKHYDSGNMQKTQSEAEAKGVEWISIVSSAPGRQGNVTPEQAAQIVKDAQASPNFKILDPTGEIGHSYNAETTPDMVVIDKDGKIAYMGAIDDQPSPNPETIPAAKNYVLAAIDDLSAGKPVETPFTQSYGCSIKYAQ